MHGKMPMLYRNSPSSAADTPGRIPLGGSVAIASCGAELVDSAGAALQHVSRGEDNNRSTQRHDADMHHPQI
jgi:hypothetical protein